MQVSIIPDTSTTMKGYKTSTDYKKLKELLDEGYEVIIIKDSGNEIIITFAWKQLHFYHIGNRTYNDGLVVGGHETFEEYCKCMMVEFIEPND